jgi:thioredoxin-dependent peroxiredoxin
VTRPRKGFVDRIEEGQMAVGETAPDFSLKDQHGESRDMLAYRNRWVVLYFYPRDDTPGCTREACRFRDDYPAAKNLGAEILGISVDSSESHAAFAGKYGLPFPLLADTDGRVARQYGALWSLGPLRFARRRTFIIGPRGKIEKIYRKVRPDTHSRQVLEDLRRLQETPTGR